MKSMLFILAVTILFGTITTLAHAKDQEQIKVQARDPKQINQAESEAIVVRVVSVSDCVNTPPTIKLIHEAAVELGLHIDLVRQLVSTQEEANKYRFIGSPTVQIDGLDLQPDMRTNTKYGFT